MGLLETLENDLKQAKYKIKIAKAVGVVIEHYINRDEYTFYWNIVNEMKTLFKDELCSFSGLEISLQSVEHFEHLSADYRKFDLSELKKALRLIEKNKEDEVCQNIIHKLINEQFI